MNPPTVGRSSSTPCIDSLFPWMISVLTLAFVARAGYGIVEGRSVVVSAEIFAPVPFLSQRICRLEDVKFFPV